MDTDKMTPNPWPAHSAALTHHRETDGLDNLLAWSTIRATMYVGESGYLHEELDELQALPDWEHYRATCLRNGVMGDDLLDGLGCNAIHQAYHLAQFEQRTGKRVDELSTIVEFGGGYGELAHVIYKLGFRGMYYLYDLPEMLTIANHYLSKNNVPVILGDALDPIKHKPDLFIALLSLCEVPIPTRAKFMKAITPKGALCLYQETFDPYDNIQYFTELQATYPLTWQGYPAPRMPSHHYLIA